MVFSPTRLVLARKLRGYTLAELGRRANLSAQTINRYENGRQEPAPESLARLADSLSLPAEFFGRGEVDSIPVDAVNFRALSKTPAFRRDAALAAGEVAIQIADWIAARFRLPDPDVPSLRLPQSPTVDDVESIAERVRARWNLGSRPIPNMVHLLEAHGTRVFSLAQEVRDVDAFSLYHRTVPFVFLDTGKTAERQRFDAAHELGHLVMHHGAEKSDGREGERHADRFAAAFLMPRNDILAHDLRNAGAGTIIKASRRWKVSAMALTHRLWELNLLTEWGYRSSCVDLAQRGYRRGEPGSDLIPESSQILAKVLAHLRSAKLGVRALVTDLALTHDEFNRHVFTLATTIRTGNPNAPRRTAGPRGEHLRIISG